MKSQDTIDKINSSSVEDKCTHEKVYIEKACCSPIQNLIECACNGQDTVVCENLNCTGIEDDEVDELFFRFTDSAHDCED